MSARTFTILARIYLLELLFSILPGSWAQVRLVETGGMVTTEGQSVVLTCRASGFDFKEHAMSWHWSQTGSNKELLASITAGASSIKEYSPRIQGRAFISRDNEAQTGSLTLSQLRKEDSGKYYCARLTHPVMIQEETLTQTWD